jgi:hypothetical protein
MKDLPGELKALRRAIASLPADVSNDAIGTNVPKVEEIFAPETHAAALDPVSPVVLGARGTGKSFWAGALGDPATRAAASKAYPRLGLSQLDVEFGFTGIGGLEGIDREKLDSCVPPKAGLDEARLFWWATILRALEGGGRNRAQLSDLVPCAADLQKRELRLAASEHERRQSGKSLLIVYDALDTVATSWPRRRVLTTALLEVVWAMRAYRNIRPKLFLRPDQIEDDKLRFVELPKLRTGAVRLMWSGTDLYGLLFARLALGAEKQSFSRLLKEFALPIGSQDEILAREWSPGYDRDEQRKLMTELAGPYMAAGPHGYKKGNTYDWPLSHLGDAFNEVTPRSFLGLMTSAAKFGAAPPSRAITPDGIRHGLRAASKTRVDQLHQEFPWIKGVLAPLAGLLLPQDERQVFAAWKRAKTLKTALENASQEGYLPPTEDPAGSEEDLYQALERIGVMFRRKDQRLDMPDLFRVAAKLLKKGGTAPV